MIEHEFPYLDTRDLNLDWILKSVKNVLLRTAKTEENLKALTEYVQDYFKNLNVQEEIDNKLDEMVDTGIFDYLSNRLGKYPLYSYSTPAVGLRITSVPNAEIGVNADSTEASANYYNRDAVNSVNVNENFNEDMPIVGYEFTVSTWTDTEVTPIENTWHSYIRKGMYVQLYTDDISSELAGYTGTVTDYDTINNIIYVDKWVLMGTTEGALPVGVQKGVLGIITRLYGNLTKVRDNNRVGAWYRESFGNAIEIYADNVDAVRDIGEVIYIRRAASSRVIPLLISNVSQSTIAHGIWLLGDYSELLGINNQPIIAGDGRLAFGGEQVGAEEIKPVITISGDTDIIETFGTIPENYYLKIINTAETESAVTFTGYTIWGMSSIIIPPTDIVTVFVTANTVYLISGKTNTFFKGRGNFAGDYFEFGAEIEVDMSDLFISGNVRRILMNNSTSNAHTIVLPGYAIYNGAVTNQTFTHPARTMLEYVLDGNSNTTYIH